MKFLHSASVVALLLELSYALPQDLEGTSMARPLLKKRVQDCGTWRMKCKNAAGACNNACYYINCINGKNNKFAWGPSPVDNRVHSGCTTTASSLCKSPPFSMRSWDQSNDAKPMDCDEFPMNAFKQQAYKDGTHRNSLRCINNGENRSGGSQFGQFQRGIGDWKPDGKFGKDRTCKGAMGPDDTFSVDFVIDGDDGIEKAKQRDLIPYCLPNPNCANDGFQFHMSKLDISETKAGRMSNPYNYKRDNHYAVDGAGDIRLYRISILRRSSKTFDVTVYERNGKDELIEKKKKTESPEYGKWFQLDDAFPKQSLAIRSNGAPGTELNFNVGHKGGLNFNQGDFVWKSGDTGIAGAYCEVGGVNRVGIETQTINCDVPVLA
ncbi:hypothetical protein CC86DRAFT_373160 [Ophiobolus disseminans]|uniref:Uncharacterized protein n=1 Tax=Ophiobolus disseminans TaxID=1469910 RepID=A0A6A6ZLD6_9PLEO|nr:hypothetical protein CC86DRAFT_373160 [Ophiobolus disseminans]